MQYALRDELIAARDKYKAKAAAGIIADVNTGEIVAMVSEPPAATAIFLPGSSGSEIRMPPDGGRR